MANDKLMNPLRKLEQEVSLAKGVKDIVKIDLLAQRYIANYEAVSGRKDGKEKFEREALAFIDVAATKPEIMECDPFSIMAGFVKAGWTGLSFQSGRLSVYPRGTKQKDGSYKKMLVVEPEAHGKREILERQPEIKKIDEGVIVFNKDKFRYNPASKQVVEHEQDFPLPNPSEQTVKAAYCRIHFTDNHFEDVVLSLEELKKARSKSVNVSYVDGQKVKDGGELWNKFYGEACKKSCYNRAYKIHFKLPDTAITFPQYEGHEDEDTQDISHTDVNEPDSFVEPVAPERPEEQTQEAETVSVEEVKQPEKPKAEKASKPKTTGDSFLD